MKMHDWQYQIFKEMFICDQVISIANVCDNNLEKTLHAICLALQSDVSSATQKLGIGAESNAFQAMQFLSKIYLGQIGLNTTFHEMTPELQTVKANVFFAIIDSLHEHNPSVFTFKALSSPKLLSIKQLKAFFKKEMQGQALSKEDCSLLAYELLLKDFNKASSVLTCIEDCFSGISMMIISGFIHVLGLTVFAISIAALCLQTIVVTMGVAAIAFGAGLAAIGFFCMDRVASCTHQANLSSQVQIKDF